MENNTSAVQQPMSGRLASLDILRGFDLFLLVFFQPVFVAIMSKLNVPYMDGVMQQFDHVAWEGFHAWDLIMPLFLFMSGVSMPFSLSKYTSSPNKGAVYKKIFRRFIILFILGMIVQGNLLGLDPRHIYFYTNTLQAIAVGYLISAMILLHCNIKIQVILTLLLLLIYWLPMTFCGDFTPTGNFAERVDRLILGRFRDGAYWNSDGTWSFSPDYVYTWIWSSLTFGATVMSGTFAGQMMKRAGENRKKVAIWMFLLGVSMLIYAWLLSFQMPIIKRIWTVSMVLLSSGICYILMSLFYFWIDVCGHSRGLNWLKIYGMNSITAYVLGETINFRSAVASVSYGLQHYLGTYYDVWLTFGNFLIIFFILMAMYRCKVFLKI